jgi:two-component system cell cycle sensor histidine kinase/response regulator CckA
MQRALVDGLPDPAWVKDAEGRYLMVNGPLAELAGAHASAIEGRADAEVWPPREAASFQKQDREVIASGEARRGVVLVRAPGGLGRWLEVVRVPIRDDEGVIVAVAGHARDVTERIEAEARRERDRARLEDLVQERTRALEEANARLRSEAEDRRRAEDSLHRSQKLEALGRLAGGVVHDVNNLLAVVKSAADALHRGVPPDELGELAFEIADAARRGTALTRQLLAFSRRQPVEPRELELAPLIEGMTGMLARLMPGGIRVRTALSPKPLRIRADPGQVEQVVMNLVVNARDAMPAGGEVLVTTAQASEPGRGSFAVIAVRDEGVGMTEEVMAHVFEPFFTTKEPGRGTGLGLATVFGVAQQAGGFVTVESAPGKGSTFRVHLPLVS